jgi:NADH-quinone oxidoreductase subunit K
MIRVFLGTALTGVFVVGLGLVALGAGGSRSLNAYLVLSSLLFAIGMFGFLARRNAISMLMSIELMLNAVNLTIVAFGSFIPKLGVSGSVIALLVIAAAAAEATVGLAIVIAIYRNKKTPLVDEYDAMSQ